MTDGCVTTPLLLDTWEVVLSTGHPKTPIGETAGTVDGAPTNLGLPVPGRKETASRGRDTLPGVPNLPSVFEQVNRVMSDQGVRGSFRRRLRCSTAV